MMSDAVRHDAAAVTSAPAAGAQPAGGAPRAGGSLWGRVKDFFEDEESVEAVAAPAPARQPARLKASWYYWIFAASGFAGLIYEAIWARYLKLFLGHAAYAQALVLAIFLFGLAVGAALCARVSRRVERPLLWYAGIEILVALTAVYFHEVFVAVQGWAIDFVLPQIESDATAAFFKWAVAAALILPQSVLLGATFPLMSAGLLRLWPASRGRLVAMLYFSNSLGAVFGVLASGFVLLPLAGLPGTIAIAGFISTAAAAAVWALGHLFDDVGAPIDGDAARAPTFGKTALGASTRLTALITAVAFGTGLASFIYEIVWIRMLSLLLGASTRTFEIMLAAFILGLAIGGWLVRRRADAAGGEILLFLGRVQLAMGALALWSLFCFPWFYEILKELLATLPRNDEGYWRYTSISFGLSLLMMLPATICAGMTLPLLTRRLLDVGGEAAVGRVYAANTLGAIVGVFITLHLLLPQLGIQQALLTGAFVDMLIGVALIGFVARARVAGAFAATVAALTVGAVFGGVSVQIASAGVFRAQSAELPEVVFYQDGKTASIAVTEQKVAGDKLPRRGIRTNGKSDAALLIGGSAGEHGYTGDEMTMVQLGLLPLLYKPSAERALNIGYGAGLTSRALLLSRKLKRLDNVEIEPAILDGARQLGGRVTPVFDDPRNYFIIDDAKSVLARAPARYEVIVSEPSNPWVSGISNLFTREFYARVREALQPDGVFIQWLPLYENEPRLVASVAQALAREFGDFKMYLSSSSNVIFVATAAEALPAPLNAVYAPDEARAFFGGYEFRSAEEMEMLLIADREIIMPYFESFNAPANSDYHPYLENNAARAFFNKTTYVLGDVLLLPVPVLEALGRPLPNPDVVPARHSPAMKQAAATHENYAARLREEGAVQSVLRGFASRSCPVDVADDEEAEQGGGDGAGASVTVSATLAALPQGEEKSEQDAVAIMQGVSGLITRLMPMTSGEKMAEVWQLLEQNECIAALLAADGNTAALYTRFWRGLSLRDSAEMIATTDALLPQTDLGTQSGQILLLGAMMGNYQAGNYQRVVLLMLDLPLVLPAVHHAARLLAANAAAKI